MTYLSDTFEVLICESEIVLTLMEHLKKKNSWIIKAVIHLPLYEVSWWLV